MEASMLGSVKTGNRSLTLFLRRLNSVIVP